MSCDHETQIPVGYAEQIDRQGFAIIEKVIDSGWVEKLRNAVAVLASTGETGIRRQTYGVRNLLQSSDEVRQLAGSQAIRSLVTPVLGERCFAVRALYFDKTPGANWALRWHQDGVIPVKEPIESAGFTAWSKKAGVWHVRPPADCMAEMLAVRVHLDACDPGNGPLRVLPGSHRHGWIDQEQQLKQWKANVSEVACCVGAGDAVMMRPLLLHASSAATHAVHRRVIHIEYAWQDLPGGLEWHQRIGN